MRFAWIILSCMLTVQMVSGAVIYADNSLGSDCIENYSPDERACTGSETAYDTISEAADIAAAGDTVYIRGGSYTEQLIPANSGNENNPIIFTNYEDEEVIITGTDLKPAIILNDREYIIIDGLRIDNVNRWLYAVKTDNCILRNNHFSRATDPGHSQKACLFFQESRFNRIENNIIEDCSEDNIAFVKADQNVVENNSFYEGFHVLFVIKCGNFNIIRNNYFDNKLEKTGEIFDCHDVGFDREFNNIVNQTKHNLVEGNIFTNIPPHIDRSPYSGIQFAGQECIIRNNLFYNNEGPGLSISLYGTEASYNLGNRIYNNVFYNNSFGGVSLPTDIYTCYDNIFKNNVLYKNEFTAHDDRWEYYRYLDGKPVQIMMQRLNCFLFERNDIFDEYPGEIFVIANGTRDHSDEPLQYSVDFWNSNFPELFSNNIEHDPGFYSDERYDFHLTNQSPMIDQGVFLTKTVSAGTGTEIPVEDVKYFFDGFDIPEETGDLIQLEGESELAYIIDIDYENNILTIDRELSWSQGQGVSLPYDGDRPDIGAFEFNLSYEPPPPPPCIPISISEMDDMVAAFMSGTISLDNILKDIAEWKEGC